jgi:DNA-binding response OmpR family regulator
MKNIYIFDGLLVDFAKKKIVIDGQERALTTQNAALLSLFFERGKVSLEEICTRLGYGRDDYIYSNRARIAISRLRRKLNDSPYKQRFIQNEWNEGYKFARKEHEKNAVLCSKCKADLISDV